MSRKDQLLLVGDGQFAQIAYEYFSYDSQYEVVGFSVETAYLRQKQLFGLPVVPFEEVEAEFPPGNIAFYAAVTYTEQNRVRTRLYKEAKEKGYRPASYISSRAFVWRNCRIGEHCFIFEGTVIQPYVSMGDNVIVWGGSHVGHHGSVGNNCFIASHVAISGNCSIGEYTFVGVNSTLVDGISIGSDCIIGADATVLGNVEDNQKVIGLWKKGRARAKTARIGFASEDD